MLESNDLFKFLDRLILLPDLFKDSKEEFIANLIGEINAQVDSNKLLVDNTVQPERKDLTKYWVNRFKIFSKLEEEVIAANAKIQEERDSEFISQQEQENDKESVDDDDDEDEEDDEDNMGQRFGSFAFHHSPKKRKSLSPVLTHGVTKPSPHNNIYMTEELWYSVTPEDLAIFTAKWAYACLKDDLRIAMDVCCGGGGNTIQLAKHFPNCIGVDNNLQHLYCTFKNSETYDISDRVSLLCLDWNDSKTLKKLARIYEGKINCIFSSPPWGGPSYLKQSTFDLEEGLFIVGGITKFLESLFQFTENVVLFLPRNSNLKQLSEVTKKLLGDDAKCRVIFIKTDGHLKGVIVMWGEKLIQ
ncbi:hypothetical protein ACO0QE_002381 [Hanseniaspora vineae]